MNIYIFIEIKNRELSSKLLLAMESAKRGHDVYLGDILPYFNRNLLKPGIFHHKSLTPSKQRVNLFKKLRKKKFKITSLDEEASHLNDHPDEFTMTRYGNKTINYAEKIFTWGKFDYNGLIKKYPKFKKKFINSGNPRVDFWKKKNFRFYKNNLINHKNYILISSNFETICGYNNLAKTIQLYRDLGYFKQGYAEKTLYEKASKEYVIFYDFVKLIKKLSLRFPKKKIIFRPHPIEIVSDWQKIFFDYKNIIVTNSGEIGSWITNSILVIHNGSTGGLEASLRKKKVISFSPKNLNIGYNFPNKISENFVTLKSAFKGVERYLSKTKKVNFDKRYDSKINLRYQNYLNNDAYLKIVDEWEKIKDKNLLIKNNTSKLKLYSNLKKIKSKFKKTNIKNNKFSDFNVTEIKVLHKKLCNIDNDFKNINIDILSGKFLRVYK